MFRFDAKRMQTLTFLVGVAVALTSFGPRAIAAADEDIPGLPTEERPPWNIVLDLPDPQQLFPWIDFPFPMDKAWPSDLWRDYASDAKETPELLATTSYALSCHVLRKHPETFAQIVRVIDEAESLEAATAEARFRWGYVYGALGTYAYTKDITLFSVADGARRAARAVSSWMLGRGKRPDLDEVRQGIAWAREIEDKKLRLAYLDFLVLRATGLLDDALWDDVFTLVFRTVDTDEAHQWWAGIGDKLYGRWIPGEPFPFPAFQRVAGKWLDREVPNDVQLRRSLYVDACCKFRVPVSRRRLTEAFGIIEDEKLEQGIKNYLRVRGYGYRPGESPVSFLMSQESDVHPRAVASALYAAQGWDIINRHPYAYWKDSFVLSVHRAPMTPDRWCGLAEFLRPRAEGKRGWFWAQIDEGETLSPETVSYVEEYSIVPEDYAKWPSALASLRDKIGGVDPAIRCYLNALRLDDTYFVAWQGLAETVQILRSEAEGERKELLADALRSILIEWQAVDRENAVPVYFLIATGSWRTSRKDSSGTALLYQLRQANARGFSGSVLDRRLLPPEDLGVVCQGTLEPTQGAAGRYVWPEYVRDVWMRCSRAPGQWEDLLCKGIRAEVKAAAEGEDDAVQEALYQSLARLSRHFMEVRPHRIHAVLAGYDTWEYALAQEAKVVDGAARSELLKEAEYVREQRESFLLSKREIYDWKNITAAGLINTDMEEVFRLAVVESDPVVWLEQELVKQYLAELSGNSAVSDEGND